MRILVTGGAGFIGSEFVRQGVYKNYDIYVVDKLTYAGDLNRLEEVIDKIKFYKIDLINMKEVLTVLNDVQPEVVVHFAAESHVDRSLLNPFEFVDSNIKGTLSLLESAKNAGIKLFVNISTDEVYGENLTENRLSEENPLKPNSPYSISKAAQEMLGRAYFRSFNLPVVTLRLCNVYGYWQYPEKLIPLTIYKATHGEKIPVYGKGENLREWLFVSDAVEGIFKAIENGKPGEVYNLGSGIEIKNIDVVKTICQILEELIPTSKPLESLITYVQDRPGHDLRYGVDFSKAIKELNYYPKTNFQEGIRATILWYLQHMDWLENKVKDLREFWNKNYR